MKAVISALALVVSCSFAVAGTNAMTRTGLPFECRFARLLKGLGVSIEFRLRVATTNETITVLTMEPITSQILHKVFPGATCYRLISSKDIVHGARYSTLLVNSNGSPAYLESDDNVVDFMNLEPLVATNEDDAKRLVQAFADLCSYNIIQERPVGKNIIAPEEVPLPLNTDYKFVVMDEGNEWRVYATMFVDDYSRSIVRYVFAINKGAKSRIRILQDKLIYAGVLVL